MIMKYLLAIFSVSFLFSCQSGHTPDGKAGSADTLTRSDVFNGLYTGVIPCADCPGIQVRINFLPDSTYSETMNYLERVSVFSDTGRWRKSDSIVTIFASADSGRGVRQFKILSDSSIIFLDGDGKIISGPLQSNYILRRKDSIPPG